MVEFGWEIVKGAIYISFGVAFVAFVQHADPKTLVAGNEFIFAQLILFVSLAFAILEFASKWVWQKSDPEAEPEPTPTPEPAKEALN